MDMTPQTWPEWYDGRHINEVLFCQQFLDKHPMKCVRGRLFTVDGLIEDEGQIGNLILEEISGVLTANLSKTVANLLASIKLQAYSPPLPIETDRIHVANGTFSRTAASVPTRATATTASPSLIIQTHPLRKSGCNSYRSCCKKMIFPPCRNFSATVCCPPPRGRRCSYSSARAARTKAALDWSCAPCWVTA